MRYYPYRATYDFECYFDHENLPDNASKLVWEAKHVPLSISICSNVEGYTQPKCFVTEGDSHILVADMVMYLLEIEEVAAGQVWEDHEPYIAKLQSLAESRKTLEFQPEMFEMDIETNETEEHGKKHPLDTLLGKYEA